MSLQSIETRMAMKTVVPKLMRCGQNGEKYFDFNKKP